VRTPAEEKKVLDQQANKSSIVHGLNEHYRQNEIDAIEVSDSWELTRYEFSALKYIQRRGKKSGTTYAKDLCKAIWYLTYCVTRDKKFTAFITEMVLAYTGECPNAAANEAVRYMRKPQDK
jgi:hypothetical protein